MVSEGKFKEAFEIIVNDNSSPAVLGVICDHQCQHKCTRLDYEESLRIRDAKKKAVLNAMDIYLEEMKPAKVISKKKVVVIGAGPGGVSTAYFLRRNGMDVTVLEKRDKPYGIVQYVIPEFRISHEMINRDYQLAVNAGVKFIFNVNENYNVPVVTGMYEENPGLDACKPIAYVVPTGNAASSMGKALPIMAKLTLKLLKGEVVKPLVDGYFAQGKRLTVLSEKIGAIRATEMLMKRLRGEEFETELPMPVFDKVEPAKAIVDY